MKVLFLDIDGVLNAAPDYLVWSDSEGGRGLIVNVHRVERLKKILEETDTKVVLSSSWRLMAGGREFVEKVGIPVMDVTDNGEGPRGEQIQRWLDAHPEVETYAIVDDDSDMLDHQRPHFVQTEFQYGLTEGLAYRLAYKLGGEVPFAAS